jgi:hypothetical protein
MILNGDFEIWRQYGKIKDILTHKNINNINKESESPH